MRHIRLIAAAVLAGGMAASSAIAQSAPVGTQTARTQTAGTQTTTTETKSSPSETTMQVPAAQPNWTVDQLITSSVHDAWVMSGRNEATFFQMVAQLAQIAAQKRGLTLTDSEETGKRFGELVKDMAKTDHDQLLYVVVDKAVQQIGAKS